MNITRNALALLAALVLVGVVALAIVGAPVPGVLEYAVTTLVGAVAGAQLPKRARA
jgi:hypothetical protein